MLNDITQFQNKIIGVSFKKCKVFPDSRGSFTEVFRSGWPSVSYSDEIQLNLSRSIKGSIRGLHFHHKQSDWWIPISGRMQIALADLRKNSPTFLQTVSIKLDSSDGICVLVPPGVAHGFQALTDITLLYAVNRYYDGSDEQGVAWNDSQLAIPWESTNPICSDRDNSNPTVSDLTKSGKLPDYNSQS